MGLNQMLPNYILAKLLTKTFVLYYFANCNSIRKHTVSYSDIQASYQLPQIHQLESVICDERNWPYKCGVPQICLQLDEQSNSSSNSIVTAIANSDAYHQSPLMDKWESMLYV